MESNHQFMKSRIIVVSGGANKTGRAIAERLAETGARIIIADINLINAEVVVQYIISRYKTEAAAISLNKTEVNTILSALKEIDDSWRNPDIWINAGQLPSLFALDDREEDQVQVVTYKAEKEALASCREVAKHMISSGTSGIIVNVVPLCTEAVEHTRDNSAVMEQYLTLETRSVSEELKVHGIKVFTVVPLFPSLLRTGAASDGEQPLADDVAMLVLYCISMLSLHTTGEVLWLKGKKILTKSN